mmetsp:Transcript_3467/g.5322  ORF Transcript_3467/g.5322 Transcript_3467/m.5322 type:complete len:91 (-) Transcript_3467:16-288(-)
MPSGCQRTSAPVFGGSSRSRGHNRTCETTLRRERLKERKKERKKKETKKKERRKRELQKAEEPTEAGSPRNRPSGHPEQATGISWYKREP